MADSGRVLIDTAFGYANFELRVPNTRQTQFRVASLTKQFTAMAVMMLQEDGRLNVRDSIGRYFSYILSRKSLEFGGVLDRTLKLALYYLSVP